MPMRISENQLKTWQNKYNTALQRVRSVKEKANEVTESLVTSMVAGGSAFAIGVADGKTGGMDLKGIPVPLLLGGLAHTAAFMGVGGKSSHLLHAVGDGALCAFGYAQGRSVGIDWSKRSPAKSSSSGLLGESSGSATLTDAELAALAA